MAEIFAVVSTALYVLCWPFIKLLQAVSFVLAPFWAATQFVLLPITYAVHAVLSIALFPFRLHVLDRIEVCAPSIYWIREAESQIRVLC